GAVLHRLAHKRAHAIELLASWPSIDVANLVDTQRRGAHEGRDIARDASVNQGAQAFVQGRPANVILDLALALAKFFFHGLVERTKRNAFAEDFQRHTLSDVALRSAVGDQRLRGPAEHIDEAWRDSQPCGVKLEPPTGGAN